jgi:hypothetical protein
MVIRQLDSSAWNSARKIAEGMCAAKAKWEANKYDKHFRY